MSEIFYQFPKIISTNLKNSKIEWLTYVSLYNSKSIPILTKHYQKLYKLNHTYKYGNIIYDIIISNTNDIINNIQVIAKNNKDKFIIHDFNENIKYYKNKVLNYSEFKELIKYKCNQLLNIIDQDIINQIRSDIKILDILSSKDNIKKDIKLYNSLDIPIDYTSTITTIWGTVNGKKQSSYNTITKGKNIGKKNATNVLTQALNEAFNKYTKRYDKITTNILLPMLVSRKFKYDSSINYYIQPKLDGVRVIAYLDDKVIKYYSRTGKEYKLDHINEDLITLFNKYPNTYFDGELYKFGLSLQQISGFARNSKQSNVLEFHIFDCFDPDNIKTSPFYERIKILDKFDDMKYVKFVKTLLVNNDIKLIDDISEKYLKQGYEGLIIRERNQIYEPGIRSNHMFKIKPYNTNEYIINGFKSGTKGKDIGALIWICTINKKNIDDDIINYNNKLLTNDQFSVVPNMTYNERYEYYNKLNKKKNIHNFKDRLLTVQYSSLSDSGIPMQPKGITIRNYE